MLDGITSQRGVKVPFNLFILQTYLFLSGPLPETGPGSRYEELLVPAGSFTPESNKQKQNIKDTRTQQRRLYTGERGGPPLPCLHRATYWRWKHQRQVFPEVDVSRVTFSLKRALDLRKTLQMFDQPADLSRSRNACNKAERPLVHPPVKGRSPSPIYACGLAKGLWLVSSGTDSQSRMKMTGGAGSVARRCDGDDGAVRPSRGKTRAVTSSLPGRVAHSDEEANARRASVSVEHVPGVRWG
ncbi:hypothetical protein AAFF_G00100430 [Aldrovandia affinis]|uniref:Uncharacterized protein n=1 Tax=Aldrovandia affinis TaxID=143900 RepID=A0AAD7RUZ8_9TELE|nr:hypothetical protein AAFF_G00100430 [Aldrovandia affinis]